MDKEPYQSPPSPTAKVKPSGAASGKQFVLTFGIAFSFAHLIISTVLYILLFLAWMNLIGNGGAPAAWERPVEGVLRVLWFPGFLVLRLGHPPNIIQLLLILLSSLLWGFGIAWLLRLCLRLRQKR